MPTTSDLLPFQFPSSEIFVGLRDSQLMAIIEYFRSVHAEMAALVTASRLGTTVKGATLYCTTFPCHECAKHIVAAGIERVVYVEPYQGR